MRHFVLDHIPVGYSILPKWMVACPRLGGALRHKGQIQLGVGFVDIHLVPVTVHGEVSLLLDEHRLCSLEADKRLARYISVTGAISEMEAYYPFIFHFH